MIKRIDLFMPPLGQYGVLSHFTKKLYEALMRCGVSCRLLEAEKTNPKPFLMQLFNDPPDCTLSFNGLLPDDEGRCFCDMINIPHVACLVDSPNHFFPLIRSPNNIITCVDRFSCDFFKGMKHENVIFMPHGVEKNLNFDPKETRDIDVLFLASYIDYEKIEKEWEKKYSQELNEILHSAAEMALNSPKTTYVEALVECVRQTGREDLIQKIDYVEILDELEMYIRGKERVQLVKAIKSPRIDIYGSGHSEAIWRHHLGKKHNVVVHEAVTFEQGLELMKRSRIVLNSCSWIKYGAHERTFAGMACGAVVLTSENSYMQQNFENNKSVLFYNGSSMDNLDNTLTSLLKDETQRKEIAKNGRDIVMHAHTWDNRAAQLIKDLAPIVKAIKG